jgi:uncharacterized membrane protein YphA (DoxX/SURF4 family)
MKGDKGGMLRTAAYGAIRLALGGVFIYAAIRKIEAPEDFADNIAAYQILPDSIVTLWALGLPLFELLCGAFLIIGYLCRIGLLSIMGLLTLFITALIAAVIRGLPINCGCFAGESWLDANLWTSLARDSILLTFSACAYGHKIQLDAAAADKGTPLPKKSLVE